MKHANDNMTPEEKQAAIDLYLNDLYDATMAQAPVHRRSIHELQKKIERIHLKMVK